MVTKYFSIRKNEPEAKTYNLKMKLKPKLDQQIGSTTEQKIGKDETHAERTEDGGREFRGTTKVTGSGRGGYITTKELKSLMAYKGQLILTSQSELEYSGAFIVTRVEYTELTPKTTKSSGTYEADITFQKVKNQPVKAPNNNATKTSPAVKTNNATKKGIGNLSSEYQKFYNKCPTLNFNDYKNIKNNSCVKTLQKLLQKNKRYLKCKVDGWFYTCTRDAVKLFKKDKGIKPVNSIVDKKVKKALLGIK